MVVQELCSAGSIMLHFRQQIFGITYVRVRYFPELNLIFPHELTNCKVYMFNPVQVIMPNISSLLCQNLQNPNFNICRK